MFKHIVRALRLPFTSASALPFIFGSLIVRDNFSLKGFILGLIVAVSTHLSANLMNDYADSKSGADWQDRTFYGLFGGSKLIQENVLPQSFYLNLAIFFALVAAASVFLLSYILKSFCVVYLYALILFLGWSYSHRPLAFSYHRLGELIIFLLFGPAAVMGGYFIQTGIFPDLKGTLLSLPFGFFTTAILFANEVPDYPQDSVSSKMTWVSITGPKKAYILYFLLIAGGFLSILVNLFLGYLGPVSLAALLFVPLTFKAVQVLKNDYADKVKLLVSSKLTITNQMLVGLVLIASALLCRR